MIQCGVEFAAEYVIPLVFPLLTAHQLNVQQFAKYILFVKDITRYLLSHHTCDALINMPTKLVPTSTARLRRSVV
jgi:hypothetical protein